MVIQRKCHSCGKWTSGAKTHCIHCQALTDPDLIAIENSKKREKEFEKRAEARESKTSKKIKEFKHSEKLGYRILHFILDTLFTIYMGILSFIVWLIAFISA